MHSTWKTRHRWEDNIIMDLRVKVWAEFIWLRTGTIGRALVNTVMNLQVP
jgi:hypothetical protein